jgi:2-hydroxychromene-2-carboxylate isomerase
MAGLKDRIRRRWLPRLVVALARRQRARALPHDTAIELYLAFDDPHAAIALPGLLALSTERGVPLRLYPLLERGIADDPAAEARAIHAVRDADRLARRQGRQLSRSQPLAAGDSAFLAAWTEGLRDKPGMVAFAAAAIEQLWFGEPDGLPQPDDYSGLHRRLIGRAPPLSDAESRPALAANHRRLLRLGHWESPAARIGSEWFLAHERLVQIGECLDRRRATA